MLLTEGTTGNDNLGPWRLLDHDAPMPLRNPASHELPLRLPAFSKISLEAVHSKFVPIGNSWELEVVGPIRGQAD